MATFNNQAILTYNGISVSSNITTGELVDVLAVTKTSLSANYSQSENVTYVVSLVNSGTTAFTGLTVADNLGEYTLGALTLTPLTYTTDSVLYYVNGVMQATLTVTENPLTFSGVSVPAGGNAVIVYQTQTNEYAPLDIDGQISNTATVTGTGISEALVADNQITTATNPVLSISKSLNPTTVSGSGTLTYTFTIENVGNTAATAGDSIVITDTFNPVLNSIAVTLNGTPMTVTTQYTYDITTGAFATVAGAVTVPAATYSRDINTGAVSVTPGTAVLTVSGTI